MKKTYINPSINIVRIETISFLADSVKFNSTKVNASEAEAREGGLIWELEEVSEEN